MISVLGNNYSRKMFHVSRILVGTFLMRKQHLRFELLRKLLKYLGNRATHLKQQHMRHETKHLSSTALSICMYMYYSCRRKIRRSRVSVRFEFSQSRKSVRVHEAVQPYRTIAPSEVHSENQQKPLTSLTRLEADEQSTLPPPLGRYLSK